MLRWLLLLGVLVAIMAGGWWWFRGLTGPTKVDPLAYIPGDAEAIAVVRVAEMWKKLPPPKNGDHDPVPELAEDIGLVPEQVECVWLVWHRPKENIGWAIIRTTQKLDRAKLVGKLRGAVPIEQAEHEAYTGKVSERRPPVALVFLDDFTALVGSETGVRHALTRPGEERAEDSPLASTLKGADKHDVGFALHPKGEVARPLVGVSPVREIGGTIDVVEGKAKLFGAIICQDERAAEQVVALVQVVPLALQLRRGRWFPGNEGEGRIDSLVQSLLKTPVALALNAVILEWEGEAGEVVRTLASLPRALK